MKLLTPAVVASPLVSPKRAVSAQRPFKRMGKLAALSAILLCCGLGSGCSVFGVYKIDLPQGTPITQSVAQQVQVGMSSSQVVYLIGSPALRDTLAPKRWDYIYDYTPGTYGKRDGKPDVHDAKQHLTIYFDDAGRVSRIEGIESLPSERR